MTSARDDAGRYDVALEAVCKCGHAKGQHEAGPKGRSVGACIHDGSDDCGCTKFTKAKPCEAALTTPTALAAIGAGVLLLFFLARPKPPTA